MQGRVFEEINQFEGYSCLLSDQGSLKRLWQPGGGNMKKWKGFIGVVACLTLTFSMGLSSAVAERGGRKRPGTRAIGGGGAEGDRAIEDLNGRIGFGGAGER